MISKTEEGYPKWGGNYYHRLLVSVIGFEYFPKRGKGSHKYYDHPILGQYRTKRYKKGEMVKRYSIDQLQAILRYEDKKQFHADLRDESRIRAHVKKFSQNSDWRSTE